MEVLKGQASRVKVDVVKTGIDRVATLLAELGGSRDATNVEFRAKLSVVNHLVEATDNALAARMDMLENKVLGTLNLVQTKLASQNVLL